MRVVFLGKLRDLAGVEEQSIDGPLDWPGLLEAMPPVVTHELREGRVSIACRGRVVANPTALSAEAGDEVALLPPVSGG